MTKIDHSYMVWAGAEHYPTFDHLLDEIKRIGFSKRIHDAAMGRALLRPGTVLYIAHDDGKVEQCKACQKLIECPECRLRKLKIAEHEEALEKTRANFTSEEALNSSGYAKRTVAILEKKISRAKADIKGCLLCKGKGKAKLGSGGSVKLSDGKTWDYRTYTYWVRQPDKFDASSVVHKSICEECGGRGCLPVGHIHGAFLLDRVEYQSQASDRKSQLPGMDEFTFVKEPADRRLSGEREPGGFYAVALPDRNPRAQGLAQQLVNSGIISQKSYAVYGSFVQFLKPIRLPLGAKRFRGVASYGPKG